MLAALTALCLVVATADQPKLSADAQKELKKLEGRWKVVKFGDSNGEYEANRRDWFWAFKGAVATLEFGQKEDETLEIAALDPGTDPKCIDLIEKTKGQ